MRQALEMALDWIKKQPEETPDSKYDVDTRYVVIREIEAALAQPEQDWIERERAVGYREGHQNALKQMAQPEQDEVDIRSRLYQRIHELETQLAQPEQAPVATDWSAVHEKLELVWYRELSADEGLDEVQDLISTTPPQRKPLTVDEVWQNNQLMLLNAELGCGMDLLMEVVEAIEAAHGIKE